MRSAPVTTAVEAAVSVASSSEVDVDINVDDDVDDDEDLEGEEEVDDDEDDIHLDDDEAAPVSENQSGAAAEAAAAKAGTLAVTSPTSNAGVGGKGRVFTCPDCGKVFNAHYNLTRHMPVHTGARPFVCKVPWLLLFFAKKFCPFSRHDTSKSSFGNILIWK